MMHKGKVTEAVKSSAVEEAVFDEVAKPEGNTDIPDAEMEKLRTNLTAQLHEIEILESMYSPGEFYLHNPEARVQLEDFCMDKSPVTPPEISYDIRLQCESAVPQTAPVELVATVTYPFEYPSKAPNVYVRFLNHYTTRQHQQYLNKVLQSWITAFSKGDPCILQVFTWLEQNTTSHVSSIRPLQLSSIVNEGEQQLKDVEYERLWIYCHHIYSREKREAVLAKAKLMELTGFLLTGKPGVICVEGLQQDTKKFYDQIRRLNWQRITLKHQENFTVPVDNTTLQQKFDKFKEITAVGAATTTGQPNRDMGEVFRFLKDHACESIIPILFGIKERDARVLV